MLYIITSTNLKHFFNSFSKIQAFYYKSIQAQVDLFSESKLFKIRLYLKLVITNQLITYCVNEVILFSQLYFLNVLYINIDTIVTNL